MIKLQSPALQTRVQMEGNGLQPPWQALYEADPVLLVYLHSPTLQSLDISQCGLTELPASMAAMTALRTLNVAHNALVTLPRALGALPALEALCVDGNPLAPHLAAMLEKVSIRSSLFCILDCDLWGFPLHLPFRLYVCDMACPLRTAIPLPGFTSTWYHLNPAHGWAIGLHWWGRHPQNG